MRENIYFVPSITFFYFNSISLSDFSFPMYLDLSTTDGTMEVLFRPWNLVCRQQYLPKIEQRLINPSKSIVLGQSLNV